MLPIDKTLIAGRQQTLDNARAALKNQFIGIDAIIDALLDYIQVWYLLPDILTRPVVVNLWGMTGVGKTDLVRKLVKHLNFQDRFAEVELSNGDGTNWYSSVASIFENQGFDDAKPCIVLFDEIQRFNTIDSDGEAITQTKFADFWELLSDGRLSKKSKDDLDQYLYRYLFRQRENQRKKAQGKEIDDENPTLGLWDAEFMKKSLNLDMSLDELAGQSEEQLIGMILHAKQQKAIYEPISHAKTLVIISGNLDEAFSMAHQTAEADLDADVFHAYTKKITVMDIKNALTKRFRPEQVARFGNIHLIYNSLRKTDFEQLIAREIARIERTTTQQLSIRLTIDESVNRLIYRNGVFPVQGVRPVFSSVLDIVDANLSKYLFRAIMDGTDCIDLRYDETRARLVARIGTDTVETDYVGRIDRVRQSQVADTVASVSVHESGHAVAYMVLTGLAPLQLKSKVADSYAGGFTFPHEMYETRQSVLDKAKIYLAGGLAEELLFGPGLASTGRSHDREMATKLVINYVRRYGFSEKFQTTYSLENHTYAMEQNVTDAEIETIMTRLVTETTALLAQHRALLHELSQGLNQTGSLTIDEVAIVGRRHGLTVAVREEGFLIIPPFQRLLDQR
jgi:hypothetical protein